MIKDDNKKTYEDKIEEEAKDKLIPESSKIEQLKKNTGELGSATNLAFAGAVSKAPIRTNEVQNRENDIMYGDSAVGIEEAKKRNPETWEQDVKSNRAERENQLTQNHLVNYINTKGQELLATPEAKEHLSKITDPKQKRQALLSLISDSFKKDDSYTKLQDEIAYYNLSEEEREAKAKASAQNSVANQLPSLRSDIEQMLSVTREVEGQKQVDKVQDILDKEKNPIRRGLALSAHISTQPGTIHPETDALNTALKYVQDSERIMREHNDPNKDSFSGKMKSAWRGFKDKAFSLDNWTLGVTEAMDQMAVNDIARKVENDEQLSDAETKLMDALALNLATNLYYDEGNRGYTWGSIPAESLPFMLEFMLNPVTGAGNALAKNVAKYGVKKFGSKVAQKGMQYAGRLAGDLTTSALMTATTGSVRTITDVEKRMQGEHSFDFNNETGDIEYAGREGQGDGLITAMAKGIGSQFIEYQSEMFGERLGAIGEVVGATKLGANIGNKFSASMFGKVAGRMGNSNIAKNIKGLERRAQWSGVIGEWVEEQQGTFMNALFIGDEKMSDLVNKDQQIDTFMGLLLSGGVMSGLQTTGYATDRLKTGHKLNKLDNIMPEYLSNWEELKGQISEMNVDDRISAIKELSERNDMSLGARQNLVDYISTLSYNDAMKSSFEESVSEDSRIASEKATDMFYTYLSDKRASLLHQYSNQMNELGNLIPNLVELEASEIDELIASEQIDSQDLENYRKYHNLKSLNDGIVENLKAEVDNAIQPRLKQYQDNINEDGETIIQINLGSEEQPNWRFVNKGNVVLNEDGSIDRMSSSNMLYSKNEDGKTEQIALSRVYEATLSPYADIEEEIKEEAYKQIIDPFAKKIDGETIHNINDQVEYVDTKGNPKKGQIVEIGEHTITMIDSEGKTEIVTKNQLNNSELTPTTEDGLRARDEITVYIDGIEHNAYIDDIKTDGTTTIGVLDSNNPEHMFMTLSKEELNNMRQPQMPTDAISQAEQLKEKGINNNETVTTAPEQIKQTESKIEEIVSNSDIEESEEEKAEREYQEFEQSLPRYQSGQQEGEINESKLTPSQQTRYFERNFGKEDTIKAVQAQVKKLKTDRKKQEEKVSNNPMSIKERQKLKNIDTSIAEYEDYLKGNIKIDIEAQNANKENAKTLEESKAVQEEARELDKERGQNQVSDDVVQKWNAAPKIEGTKDIITLANGENIEGTYFIAPASAPTPSHDPQNNYAKSIGFPLTADGSTVNDRDYEKDKDAQIQNQQRANSFDMRAVQTPVVVSRDGVVLSGNDRTMAGQQAAMRGTDKAYNDYIRQQAGKWGFTQEQIETMPNARIVFVPDADMPYTTETFAKFNAEEKKSQNTIEKAVKISKTIDVNDILPIANIIDKFDRLSDMYQNAKGTKEILDILQDKGIVMPNEVAKLVDTNGQLSEEGKSYLETLLLGSVLNEDSLRIIDTMRSIKQTLVRSMPQIMRNLSLKDYNLSTELNNSIHLLYEAKQAGNTVQLHLSQTKLFEDSAADMYDNIEKSLAMMLDGEKDIAIRNMLDEYNKRASDIEAGLVDMFDGTLAKPELLDKIIKAYGTKEESSTTGESNQGREERKDVSVEQTGATAQLDGESKREKPAERGLGQRHIALISAIQKLSTQFNIPVKVHSSISTVTNKRVLRELEKGERVKGWYDVKTGKAHIYLPNAESIEDVQATFLHEALAHKALRDVLGDAKHDQLLTDVFDALPKETQEKLLQDYNGDKKEATDEYIAEVAEKGEFMNMPKKNLIQIIVDAIKNLFSDFKIETSAAEILANQALNDAMVRMQEKRDAINDKIDDAAKEVDTNPTEAQKEAGNYKKGHVTIQGLDISIEQPKGSVRSGTDDTGKKWSQKMNNHYGYFKGTESRDGDHIDVFVGDNPNSKNVYVVDQVNKDGSFDEHKVMLGFDSMSQAYDAYLSNYEDGWQGLGTITPTNIEDFKKWAKTDGRRIKAFAEYIDNQKTYVTETVMISPTGQPSGGVRRTTRRMSDDTIVTDEIISYDNGIIINREDYVEPIAKKYNPIDHATQVVENKKKNDIDEKLESNDILKDLEAKLRDLLGDDNTLFRKDNKQLDRDIAMFEIGTKLASEYFKSGVVDYKELSDAMIRRVGKKIIPYIKSFYEGVRYLPSTQQYKLSSQENVNKITDSLLSDVKVEKKPKKEDVISKQLGIFEQQTTNQLEDEKTGRNNEESIRLGESQRKGSIQNEREGVDRGNATNNVDNETGSRGAIRTSSKSENSRRIIKNSRNNKGERGIDYAPVSFGERYKANINAIKLLKDLEQSGRDIPTEEEAKILRQYSGWGGLGTIFNNNNSNNAIIRELLTEEEYEAAELSINSAYYTPAYITDTLWDVATKLGFKGGNILESSAGIGNILGQMPSAISEKSNIEATELDSISGNILRLLYPDAKVNVSGFEDTDVRPGTVDLAITNVPFVTGLSVYDGKNKDLSKKFKNIHDFFIAKNIRALKEGGIGIFITSNGTLDKSKALRNWIGNDAKADVIGAFRLNNDTFRGAKVTSDIIIVRKRVAGQKHANAIDISQTAVERTTNFEGKQTLVEYNSYFIDNPQFTAGDMKVAHEMGETFRPYSLGMYPSNGKAQKKQLEEWLNSINTIVPSKTEVTPSDIKDEDKPTEVSQAREGELTLTSDGTLAISQRGEAVPLGINSNKVKGKYEKAEVVKDYIGLKNALNEALEYQANNNDDSGLKPYLDKLNKAYDTFVKKYDSINNNRTISFLNNDIDFPTIAAIEKYEEAATVSGKKKITIEKTDVFKGRVVGIKTEAKPTNLTDGVIASTFLYGAVNIDYIAKELGLEAEQVRQNIIKDKLGYENPENGLIEVPHEYLSGNVREKLEIAKSLNDNGQYNTNISELEKVIPMDIPAHLIEFSLGSSWVGDKILTDYAKDKFDVDISLSHVEGIWIANSIGPHYNEKNREAGITSEKLRTTRYGHELFLAALNNKSVPFSRSSKNSDGTTDTIVDKEASQAASTKIDEMRSDFKDWSKAKMQADPVLANEIETIYNNKFNAIAPLTISPEFIPKHFEGANPKVTLYPHQGESAIRSTMQPIMLAHEVGSGKTFTIITSAMEMKRLGTAQKPMIVVQNATVGQFVESAKFLYPNAKVLTISPRDRTAAGRKEFYAKIKYNDWDMIIIPQSVFDMIPDSIERQAEFIREKIEEKVHTLENMETLDVDGHQLKNTEKELAELEVELSELLTGGEKRIDAKTRAKASENVAQRAKEQLDRRTDDIEDFDSMGIDALLIDEAHNYKKLGFSTTMQRGIKGIDTSRSKKAAGAYLKTRAVYDKAGWKNVVFATGTPISNTAAELWTFMRYLMPTDVLKANDMYYFDDFVRNFGSISQMLEFTTSGKFRENTRFSSYVNKPELIRLWASVAHTVLSKDVKQLTDKLPDIKGGKAQDIFLPQTNSLIDIMRAVKAQLQAFEEMTGKEKKENSHIPLVMYGVAKRAAIDTRLVDKNAPDEKNSKTNKAVQLIVDTLNDKEISKYKGTIAVFSEVQNRKDADGTIGFNLFQDMKKKLIEQGVDPSKIAIIESSMSMDAKMKIFDAVNSGDIRVVMGSTQTLGTGVNIQERLNTLIHMDLPDRPMDYTQRNGRILRQGNIHKEMNKEVNIIQFGVEDSLDVTSFQRLQTKSDFIDSIMDGKSALENNQEDRILEEPEEGLFENSIAVLSGSQYALLKNQAEREYRKVQYKKKQHENDQVYIANKIKRNKSTISINNNTLEDLNKELKAIKAAFPTGKATNIKIEGQKIDNATNLDLVFKDFINKPINEKVDRARKNANFTTGIHTSTIEIDGLEVKVHTRFERRADWDNRAKSTRITMSRDLSYSIPSLDIVDVPVSGQFVRGAYNEIIDNVITGINAKNNIEGLTNANTRMQDEIDTIEPRLGKEFEQEEDLSRLADRVEEMTRLMQEELKAKEAKYAAIQSESKSSIEDAIRDEEDVLFRITPSEIGQQQSIPITDELREMAPEGMPLFRKGDREAREAYAIREWKRAVNAVTEISKRLNVDVEILETTEGLTGRKSTAKGWFDPKTGKITIVMPNHSNSWDVQSTLLHEAVGHYGLRKLFGDNFYTFLDNVYNASEKDIRDAIDNLAKKHKGNRRTATEEYLSQLAEDPMLLEADRRGGFLGTVRRFFMNMLAKVGFNPGFELSNNELRYILWRSYSNLAEPGRYKSIDDHAKDIAMQEKLKIGNYANMGSNSNSNINDDIRFRQEKPKIDIKPLDYKLDNDYADYYVRFSDHIAEDMERGWSSWNFGQEGFDGTEAELNQAISEVDDTNPLWISGFEMYPDDLKKADIRELYKDYWVVVDDTNAINGLSAHYISEKADTLGDLLKQVKENSSYNGWGDGESFDSEYSKVIYSDGNMHIVQEGGIDNDIRFRKADELFSNPTKINESVGDYNKFLSDVFNNSSQKSEILKDARQSGMQLDKSIENYIANEATYEEVESIAKDLGIDIPVNAVRYMFWQKANPNDGTAVWKAKDAVKYHELRDGVLFRKGEPITPSAIDEYEDKVRSKRNNGFKGFMFGMEEGWFDRMASLRILEEAILGGKRAKEGMSAYMLENQLSSRNTAEIESYQKRYLDPMIKIASDMFGKDLKSIDYYLMAKHGFERNARMAKEEIARKSKKKRDSFKEMLSIDEINQDEYDELIEKQDNLDAINAENLEKTKDYSGLTQLYKELTGEDGYGQEQREYLKEYVSNIELKQGKEKIDKLWSSIRSATQFMIRKQFDSGMMSKANYDNIVSMYEYYVPLRGFDDVVATDIYEYLINKPSDFNKVLMKAKGRTSMAESPFASILNMGESGIMQANRNNMKKALYRLVATNPSNLASIKDVWYVETADGYEERVPDIPLDATGEEVSQIVDKFEADMLDLEEQGFAYRGRNKLDLGLRVGKAQASEHAVNVWINGEEKVVYVNGNPRAAQAINGLTNSSAKERGYLLRTAQFWMRQMSANFTSRNPAFMVTNAMRDWQFAILSSGIKHGGRYSMQLVKNTTIVGKTVAQNIWGDGNKDNSKFQQLWEEFSEYGGETGYAIVHSMDANRKYVNSKLREFSNATDYLLPFRSYVHHMENANRLVEANTRFAAYVTSREMGKSIEQSIANSKDVSINFNRKGSGGFGAGIVHNLYLFANPALQSMRQMGLMAKNHPIKFTLAMSTTLASGYMIPLMNEIMLEMFGDDDDKDKYFNLSDWTRRNHIVMYAPWTKNRFITLSLPHELRGFYGLGEMAYSAANGKMRGKNIPIEALKQFANNLPIDPTGGKSTLAPDVIKPFYEAYITNENFMGTPIYKDSPWNKHSPEWTKAYKRTSPMFVKATKALNELTGGDDVIKGKIDINPAKIQHVLGGYVGGAWTTYTDIVDMAANLITGEEISLNDVPIANKIIRTSDERNKELRINNEYFYWLDWKDKFDNKYKGYKKWLYISDNHKSDEMPKYKDKLINTARDQTDMAIYEMINTYSKIIKETIDAGATKEEMKLKNELIDKLWELDKSR